MKDTQLITRDGDGYIRAGDIVDESVGSFSIVANAAVGLDAYSSHQDMAEGLSRRVQMLEDRDTGVQCDAQLTLLPVSTTPTTVKGNELNIHADGAGGSVMLATGSDVNATQYPVAIGISMAGTVYWGGVLAGVTNGGVINGSTPKGVLISTNYFLSGESKFYVGYYDDAGDPVLMPAESEMYIAVLHPNGDVGLYTSSGVLAHPDAYRPTLVNDDQMSILCYGEFAGDGTSDLSVKYHTDAGSLSGILPFDSYNICGNLIEGK